MRKKLPMALLALLIALPVVVMGQSRIDDFEELFNFSELNENKPEWFTDTYVDGDQTEHTRTVNGLAAYGERLYLAGATGWQAGNVPPVIHVVDIATGQKLEDESVNTTGIIEDGGNGIRNINDIDFSEDGLLFGANFLNPNQWNTFKVWQLSLDPDVAPVKVIDFDGYDPDGSTLRLGDKITVTGSASDNTLRIATTDTESGGEGNIYSWSMTGTDKNGDIVFGDVEIIEGDFTRAAFTDLAFLPDGSFYYYGVAGPQLSKYDAEGNHLGDIALYGWRGGGISYLGHEGDDELLAIYRHTESQIRVLRVVGGTPEETVLEFETPINGLIDGEAVGEGLGDIDFIPADDGQNVKLFLLNPNHGYAAFKSNNLNLDFPVDEPVVTQVPYETNFSVDENWVTGTGYAGGAEYHEAGWSFVGVETLRAADGGYLDDSYNFQNRGDFTITNEGSVTGLAGFSLFIRDWMTNEGADRDIIVSTDGGSTTEVVGTINQDWFDNSDDYFEFYHEFDESGLDLEEGDLVILFEGSDNNDYRVRIGGFEAHEAGPETYQVTLIVQDTHTDQPVEGATITFEDDEEKQQLVTDEEGTAIIDLPDGSYNATITMEYYQDKDVNFIVDGQEETFTFELEDLITNPFGLSAEIIVSDVLLTWNPEPGKAFLGFNVFLNDMDTPIAEDVMETEFLITDAPIGTHTAGIQAIHSSGTSEITTIDFTIESHIVTFSVKEGEGTLDATIGEDTITSGDEVYDGATVAFLAAPDSQNDWYVGQWHVNGEVYGGAANMISLVVEEDVDVEVEFIQVMPADPLDLLSWANKTGENIPVEIGTDGNARGADLYMDRYVIVASRELGPQVYAWDLENPDEDPIELDMGDDVIEPLTFPINYVRTAGEAIYVSNLSLNPSGEGWAQGVFQIYRWNSLEDEPEVVISYDVEPGRLGDAFSIIGDPMQDGKIMAHINSDNLRRSFRVWNFEDGVLLNEESPDLFTLNLESEAGLNNHGIVNPIEGEDDLFVATTNNAPIWLVNAEGEVLSYIPTSAIHQRAYDPNIFYHDGKRFLSYTINNDFDSEMGSRVQVIELEGETLEEAFEGIFSEDIANAKMVYEYKLGDGHVNLTAINRVSKVGDEFIMLSHVVGNGFVVDASFEYPETFMVEFTVTDETESYEAIELKGEMTGWETVPMVQDGNVWTLELEMLAGTYEWGIIENDGSDDGIWLIVGDNLVVTVDPDGTISGDTSYTIEEDDTSVDMVDAATFKIYPNPAHSVVNLSANAEINEVFVTDMSGRRVYSNNQINSPEHQIQLSGLEAGIYIIQVHTTDGLATEKLQILK